MPAGFLDQRFSAEFVHRVAAFESSSKVLLIVVDVSRVHAARPQVSRPALLALGFRHVAESESSPKVEIIDVSRVYAAWPQGFLDQRF